MFIDNLTIAGILIINLYLLLPLLFRWETWRVDEDLEASQDRSGDDLPAIDGTAACPSC